LWKTFANRVLAALTQRKVHALLRGARHMGAVRKIKAPEAGDAYLGVVSSARGMTWRERLDAAGTNLAAAISQRHDLPDLLGRVLAARGIGLDEVPVALNPSIKALMPDPHVVRDMDVAAERLAHAIRKKEKIAIFGDYDVDGACSCALLTRFLAAHGLEARIYIPDRITEGYGPNPEAIEQLVREGAQLIVTVDCGTTSHAALKVARTLKTDVLVVDHHQADAELPDVAAVVNPNRQDDVSGLGHLCAAGVVFLLLVATARAMRSQDAAARDPINLLELLDLVALATVCDVVPLKGLNRASVTKGLQGMHRRRNVGLKALADAAALAVAPTTYHLGFVL
jgi:single-stranded-DNA-specific exonuclease